MMTVAGYSHFRLENETTDYTLQVDTYYGDAGSLLLILSDAGPVTLLKQQSMFYT